LAGLKTKQLSIFARPLNQNVDLTVILRLKQRKNMGRPPVLPKKKKDGFWLEIRNKGANSGIVIIRDSHQAMMQAVKQYENTKDVIILGEHKNGKRVDDGGKKKVKSAA
jgi:hypothetical protein